MTLGLLILVAVVVIVELARDRGRNAAHERRETAWTEERRELLNRIQHPERMPLTVKPRPPRPEPEPDGFNLVGVIQRDDDPA